MLVDAHVDVVGILSDSFQFLLGEFLVLWVDTVFLVVFIFVFEALMHQVVLINGAFVGPSRAKGQASHCFELRGRVVVGHVLRIISLRRPAVAALLTVVSLVTVDFIAIRKLTVALRRAWRDLDVETAIGRVKVCEENVCSCSLKHVGFQLNEVVIMV